MFNTATKAQMQELIEYIASKMSVIDVSTIADANNVEEGYFNETDNKFYKEADYTTEITGKSKTIYISLNTDLPYYFNGTNFVALSSPQQQITVDSLLDDTSENPIQNKAVTEALDDKQDALDAGDGIDITNDTISIDEMPAEDMSEIIPQLPPIRNSRMKYSTTEQIVGEWIDGKPIYQKTISCGALPNNTTKTVAHNISNLALVINVNGNAKRSSDNTNIFFPDQPIVDCYIKGSDIYIATNADRSAYTQSYVALQYTKTTD